MTIQIPGLPPLEMGSDPISAAPAFGFVHEDMFITNPRLSSCSRFGVEPMDAYGASPSGADSLLALNDALAQAANEEAFQALPAVRFERYMPDSPSYTGPVAIRLVNGLLLVSCFDKDGAERIAFDWLGAAAQSLTQAQSLNDEADLAALRQAAFNALGDDSREHIDHDATNLDLSRAQAVNFSDGTRGAVLLWGEACFVSVLRFGKHPMEFSAEATTDWPGFLDLPSQAPTESPG